MQWVLFNDVLHCIWCSWNIKDSLHSCVCQGPSLCTCNENRAEPLPLGSSSAGEMRGVILPGLTFVYCWKVQGKEEKGRKPTSEEGLLYLTEDQTDECDFKPLWLTLEGTCSFLSPKSFVWDICGLNYVLVSGIGTPSLDYEKLNLLIQGDFLLHYDQGP